MRQADLCRLTGIRSSLMSDYISGKKSPTIRNAVLIADALHISLDTLVGREPDPCQPQGDMAILSVTRDQGASQKGAALFAGCDSRLESAIG